MQICDALDAEHAKGIPHRHLKPANILVTISVTKRLDFLEGKRQPRDHAAGGKSLKNRRTSAAVLGYDLCCFRAEID